MPRITGNFVAGQHAYCLSGLHNMAVRGGLYLAPGWRKARCYECYRLEYQRRNEIKRVRVKRALAVLDMLERGSHILVDISQVKHELRPHTL